MWICDKYCACHTMYFRSMFSLFQWILDYVFPEWNLANQIDNLLFPPIISCQDVNISCTQYVCVCAGIKEAWDKLKVAFSKNILMIFSWIFVVDTPPNTTLNYQYVFNARKGSFRSTMSTISKTMSYKAKGRQTPCVWQTKRDSLACSFPYI